MHTTSEQHPGGTPPQGQASGCCGGHEQHAPAEQAQGCCGGHQHQHEHEHGGHAGCHHDSAAAHA